jgi:RNA polymerase sigma-70 factor (ECF subfamily)
MNHRGDSELGDGQGPSFQGTRWTIVHNAQTKDTSRRLEALGQLFAIYWKPVYCYLRRKGHGQEEAEDLTQGFFADVMMGTDLVQDADRSKGRFRSFLLTTLDHYAASYHRKEKAKKRAPAAPILRLGGKESFDVPEPASRLTPEEAFNYVWAAALLGDVIAEVRDGCRRDGKELHWQVFEDRVLKPIMDSSRAPSLPDVCARLGLDAPKASNMIVLVKRRFQAVLRARVQPLVRDDSEVDQEIAELMQILSTSSARPDDQ